MVLAHIEREPGSRLTQKERSRARFLTSDNPQTLPGPGVYARANSIAAPGRLPDGSPSAASYATGVEPQVVDELPRRRPHRGRARTHALGTTRGASS